LIGVSKRHDIKSRTLDMHKAAIITLGLASLGAIASAQPAFADYCRSENIACNARTHGAAICASTYLDCVHNSKRHHAVGLGFSWIGMSTLPGAATSRAAASSSTNGGSATNSGTIATTNNGSVAINTGVNSGHSGNAGGGSALLSGPGMPKVKAH
jgi:hypothetical protein